MGDPNIHNGVDRYVDKAVEGRVNFKNHGVFYQIAQGMST